MEEEDALRAGVEKHGAGKWKNILVDTEFAHRLSNRSNVDLKVYCFLAPLLFIFLSLYFCLLRSS